MLSEESAQQDIVERLRASGALEQVRVVCPSTDVEMMVAASAACSFAESVDDDVLVVIDDLSA